MRGRSQAWVRILLRPYHQSSVGGHYARLPGGRLPRPIEPFMRNRMKPSIRNNGEGGNTMMEFAVVMPFWVVLLFGTIALGINLTRSIQVVQTSRDLANMCARGTDFTSAGFQNL